jgi:arylsulfatase A-like enzyme
MTDEERYTPAYEHDAMAAFRAERLPSRGTLRARGVEFHRHYTGSTACLPSRATLFTGQYPSLHGVRNTDGLAKSADDPAMVWLDPDQVPTMGDWFRAAGYETHYRGKWHISHAEMMVTGTHKAFLTNTRDGTVVHDAVAAYRVADRLDPFGFSGWIGPEPHGPLPANTGMVRDSLFAEQVTELFDTLGSRGDDGPPWLAVASFVNPHDIAFSGMGWQALGFPPIPDWVPAVPEAPSQSDSLADRPAAQAIFRDTWAKLLYPQATDEDYRRLYHYLLAEVDLAIGRILESLEQNGLADDTIIVFTSDHGDMLGAHGGLIQKWHNAYDESIRVPLVVAGPGISGPPEAGTTGLIGPTSHVDLLPTLLGLIGTSEADLAGEVSEHHVETRELPGRDLSGLLTGTVSESSVSESEATYRNAIYFMTEDQISRGLRTSGPISGQAYDAVPPPAAIESVIAELDGSLWKLNRYYSSEVPGPGEPVGSGLIPKGEGPEDWELHNLSDDPAERDDRSSDPSAPLATLRQLLVEKRAAQRLEPTERLISG